MPGRYIDDVYGVVHAIYPETDKASSVVETALSNMNAMFHPTGMIMNTGWIERTGGNFLFYREGMTDGVGLVTKAIDDERLAVARALGVPARPFIDNFLAAGLTTQAARDSGSIAQACEDSEPNKTIKSPPSLDHRYIHEDVGYGLVPFSAFGQLAGVPTPTIDAVIHLASAATGIDYLARGLTLDRMGLAGLTPEQLMHFVETGVRS